MSDNINKQFGALQRTPALNTVGKAVAFHNDFAKFTGIDFISSKHNVDNGETETKKLEATGDVKLAGSGSKLGFYGEAGEVKTNIAVLDTVTTDTAIVPTTTGVTSLKLKNDDDGLSAVGDVLVDLAKNINKSLALVQVRLDAVITALKTYNLLA